MKKRVVFILTFLAIISLFVNLYLYQKLEDKNRVVRVIDGDTFELKDGRRVRLLGVDAPEIGFCGANEAKKLLEDLVLGKKVKLKEGDYRDYGRIMALVYAKNKLLNEPILNQDLARVIYAPNSEKEKLVNAYKKAKSQNLGIWGLC